MPTIGVAIAIPEPWASQLQDYRASIGDTTAEKIPTHITLVPPTELDDRAEVDAHLADVAAGHEGVRRAPARDRHLPPGLPGRLRDARRGHLPVRAAGRRRPPRPARRRSSTFPYHPHVTIAHHLGDPELDRAFEELSAFECSFPVTDFHLYVHDDEVGWQPDRSFALRSAPAVR